ncbi:MAG: hypothetical protein CME23_06240, partial [Gemmatimonadetes bacterium]|nr:hypothetical protein [Gemmatimonadota bacterium]
MGSRIKPILGAAVTGGLVSYFAVEFLFNPAMPDPAFEPIVENLIASTVLYWIVGSVFFDWAVQKMGKTMSTAMVIALSQILLVDVFY